MSVQFRLSLFLRENWQLNSRRLFSIQKAKLSPVSFNTQKPSGHKCQLETPTPPASVYTAQPIFASICSALFASSPHGCCSQWLIFRPLQVPQSHFCWYLRCFCISSPPGCYPSSAISAPLGVQFRRHRGPI